MLLFLFLFFFLWQLRLFALLTNLFGCHHSRPSYRCVCGWLNKRRNPSFHAMDRRVCFFSIFFIIFSIRERSTQRLSTTLQRDIHSTAALATVAWKDANLAHKSRCLEANKPWLSRPSHACLVKMKGWKFNPEHSDVRFSLNFLTQIRWIIKKKVEKEEKMQQKQISSQKPPLNRVQGNGRIVIVSVRDVTGLFI